MKTKLLIDSKNLFISNYIVNETLSTNGQIVGGIVGYLQSTGFLCDLFSPDEIYCCWDGVNARKMREDLFPGYKAGRKPLLIKGQNVVMTPEQGERNKYWQEVCLKSYLEYLPMKQIEIDHLEGDEIIGYFVQKFLQEKDTFTIIVSNDKDFYQFLQGDDVVVYRSNTKELMTEKKFIEKFKMIPKNFVLFRALLGSGDSSDNIHGISGLGEVKFYKLCEDLNLDLMQPLTLDDFSNAKFDFKKKKNFINLICEQKEKICLNIKLSDLTRPELVTENEEQIKQIVEGFDLNFHFLNLMKRLGKDGIEDLAKLEKFISCMKFISCNW